METNITTQYDNKMRLFYMGSFYFYVITSECFRVLRKRVLYTQHFTSEIQ